jgi:glycosyltransferase involved in cell wall biosynthesis
VYKGISLIILAFNEEKNIKKAIINYYDQLKKLEIPFEIIVINDGSADNTFKIISECKKKIKIFSNKKNIGFAKSLKIAINKTKFDNWMWIGGDTPDRNIYKIANKYKYISKKYDDKFIIIQYFKNNSGRSFFRGLYSNFYTFILNFIFIKNIPYYNGQSVLNKKFFFVNNLCNSRFILGQIILESLKKKPKIFFIDYKINVCDIDKTSESIIKLILTTFVDLIKYRLNFFK